MRHVKLVTTAALTMAALAPHANAAPPHPDTCRPSFVGSATPALSDGFVATGVLVVAFAIVECRAPVTTPPVSEPQFSGTVDLEIWANGHLVCDRTNSPTTSIGPALVLVDAVTCTLPVESPDRLAPIYAHLGWMVDGVYSGERRLLISPVGASL